MSEPEEDGGSLVSIRGGVLGYRDSPVLRDVDFKICRGDFFPVLGINASGKSTLLKTVVGILKPLGGTIESLEPAGRPLRVGYIPQSETLDPIFPLTVLEVVFMGIYGMLRPGRLLRREHRELALRCLRETEAEDLAGSRFSILSGGQKQRVLLARALATQPDLLVLDEPTAGIDARGEKRITELIRRINAESGVAVLMASHNLKMIGEFTSRLVWIHDGTVSIEEAGKVLPEYGLSL